MKKRFQIKPEDAGRRLDTVLARLAGRSRNQIQHLIDAGRALVDGRPAPARYVVQSDDQIELDEPVPRRTASVTQMPELPIVYEDTDVIVIDKPAGLLVHDTTTGSSEPTVAQFIAARTTADGERAGIVHRLDRDTSGVMILAKTQAAQGYLQDQFRDRLVRKTYRALVEGHLKQSEAVIELPVSRKSDSARYVISTHGKPAITGYKILAEYAKHSYLEAYPKTGRTHQIRVHFAHLGHPLAADKLYGGKPVGALRRQFLHAYQLSLTLPSGKNQTFEVDLPSDLQAVIDDLATQV